LFVSLLRDENDENAVKIPGATIPRRKAGVQPRVIYARTPSRRINARATKRPENAVATVKRTRAIRSNVSKFVRFHVAAASARI